VQRLDFFQIELNMGEEAIRKGKEGEGVVHDSAGGVRGWGLWWRKKEC
jgi:hypothetical protein